MYDFDPPTLQLPIVTFGNIVTYCQFQYVKYQLLFSMENFEVCLLNELRRYHDNHIIYCVCNSKCNIIPRHSISFKIILYGIHNSRLTYISIFY